MRWSSLQTPVLLVALLMGCGDRRIIFCDPGISEERGGCPTAGAGGNGGAGGSPVLPVGGASGAGGAGGTGGTGGVGGSGGTAGAPPVAGAGGGPSDVDASAPIPDSGIDSGTTDAAVTP